MSETNKDKGEMMNSLLSIAHKRQVPFSNGYTASVLFFDNGECEVAVKVNDKIVYDTPITNDVVRCENFNQAWDIVGKIMDLPPRDGVRKHIGPMGTV
jgi:hypothetical protein|tara:strand:+ start:229 stop:522 length:294 start_codon:yes stop_codon:yes gene_type:complete